MTEKHRPEVISSGVDALIERLRDEGVADGKKRAEQIVREAERSARATLEAAETEARERLRAASKEAEALRTAGEEALKVAARDLLLDLKAELARRFSDDVRRLVREQSVDKDFLRRMILELLGRMRDSVEIGEGEAVEVILPREAVGLADLRQRPEALTAGEISDFIFGVEGQLLRDGVRFGLSEDPQGGVFVRLVEQAIEIDATDRSVAALLLEHLQPRFRAILEGIVK